MHSSIECNRGRDEDIDGGMPLMMEPPINALDGSISPSIEHRRVSSRLVPSLASSRQADEEHRAQTAGHNPQRNGWGEFLRGGG